MVNRVNFTAVRIVFVVVVVVVVDDDDVRN